LFAFYPLPKQLSTILLNKEQYQVNDINTFIVIGGTKSVEQKSNQETDGGAALFTLKDHRICLKNGLRLPQMWTFHGQSPNFHDGLKDFPQGSPDFLTDF
jgi:hypothetical protein